MAEVRKMISSQDSRPTHASSSAAERPVYTQDGAAIYSISGGRPSPRIHPAHAASANVDRKKLMRAMGSKLGTAFGGPVVGYAAGKLGEKASDALDDLAKRAKNAADDPATKANGFVAAIVELTRRAEQPPSPGAGGLSPRRPSDSRPIP